MTDLQRIKKVIKWLIFSDFGDNEKEIAEILGYTKSSFSQILNGKVPISDKFVEKILQLDKNINKVWILTGEESMFKNEQKQLLVGPANDKYVAMLEDQLKDKEKINALQEEKIAKLEAEIQTLKSVQGTTVNQFNQPNQNKPLTQPLTQSTR
ncbi:helix-turn-helix domain-containing protein [Capnocytophaga canimorsus]|uniref:helix-turn-helix domain-containing protein n=2 Tax=Capnocytophaga canimorsus TaxID=28188 RepID=UPI0015D58F4A|nr:helix-turn-helix transcriptional regulator [Capnocytophaga canimorsus]